MHHFDLAIHAKNCILKPDLDAHEKISTGLGTGPPLATAKEIKDVPKTGEVRRESPTALPSPGIGAF
jgi:hypothetical protein